MSEERPARDLWGIFCTSVMYSSTLWISLAVNYIALPELSWLLAVPYNCIVLLLFASHWQCMRTPPGIAKDALDQELQQRMREEFQRLCAAGYSEDEAAHCQDQVKVLGAVPRKWWCVQCDTFRPKRAHHCKTCRACVLEMDHHCPWVNNCVGVQNHKYFILFVGYAWLACISSVAVLAVALFQVPEETGRLHLHSSITAQFLCLAALAVAFVFTIFASVMSCDQWTFLAEGHGVVDQKLKKMGVEKARHSLGDDQRSVWGQVSQVLGSGEDFRIWWFLPCAEPSSSKVPT